MPLTTEMIKRIKIALTSVPFIAGIIVFLIGTLLFAISLYFESIGYYEQPVPSPSLSTTNN
jgi:hypothetical protein